MTASELAILEARIQSQCTVRRHVAKPEDSKFYKQPAVVRSCQSCGKEFRVRLFRILKGEGKYCSQGCANKSRKRA